MVTGVWKAHYYYYYFFSVCLFFISLSSKYCTALFYTWMKNWHGLHHSQFGYKFSTFQKVWTISGSLKLCCTNKIKLGEALFIYNSGGRQWRMIRKNNDN